jgi:maleate cis-trans isomerase
MSTPEPEPTVPQISARGTDMTSWRGTIGTIKPTFRPGGLEDIIRLLPDGMSLVPLFVGFRQGDRKEFLSGLPAIEEKVRELAEIGVDLINPQGAPPFFVHGRAKERELLDKWESTYGIPVLTAGTSQVAAMKALGVRSIVGVTYFPEELNKTFAQYFEDAGIKVLAMQGIDVRFQDAGHLSGHEIYAFAKRVFLANPGADALYMLGAGWRVLDIAEILEQDLEVPVIQSVPCTVWAAQRMLHVRQPVQGVGRLMAEMPPLPPEGL